ncbi:MAG: hypothetical protein ACKO3P_00275, partial [Planctomycetaceae bacterium]
VVPRSAGMIPSLRGATVWARGGLAGDPRLVACRSAGGCRCSRNVAGLVENCNFYTLRPER